MKNKKTNEQPQCPPVDPARPWHWPDHNIGKRESRRLREEHNAAVNSHADLLSALEAILYTPEPMTRTEHFQYYTNATKQARAAIAKAKGLLP